MVVSKDSPKNRRKSIAVPTHNRPAALSRAKRRPHSIVPGDRLSPLAKARRSLVPRKSILKSFINITSNAEDAPASSQQSQSSTEDPSGTQSMDTTQDFRMSLANTTRKSFGGRRVSFAGKVEVRLIEGRKDGEPSSSPSQGASEAPHNAPTDENIYPGASIRRRRSSARYSVAYSEDMDLTSVAPSAFLPVDDSAIADEESDYDENSGMDMTEVIHGDLIRKRSLSVGTRLPLSQISHTPDQELSQQSFEEEVSQPYSEADSDQSQVMDFTMPLNKSLRAPAQHDETWLALRQATHSGDTPIEPELSSDDFESSNVVHAGDGMDLDDAVQRLMRARESLPSIPSIRGPEAGGTAYGHPQDETFSSMEESFEDDGNRTMNVSRVFGGPSTDGTRIGMESTMDESEIYGAIAAPAHSIDPPPPEEVVEQLPEAPSAPAVFKPPPPLPASLVSDRLPVFSAPQCHPATTPVLFSARPKETVLPQTLICTPSSPSKAKASLQRKVSISSKSPTVNSPKKRSCSQSDTVGRPSPSKRVAVNVNQPASSNNGTSANSSPKPRPLSPRKIAPFQVPTCSNAESRPSSFRRPSGYFSRRKSLGVALVQTGQIEENNPVARSSPKKKAKIGLGRVSLGSGPSDAWTRFDKSVVSKGKQKETPQIDREVNHQGGTSPILTRESPARPISPTVPRDTSPSPAVPVADISTLQGLEDEQDEGEEEMEQWRNGVEYVEHEETAEPPISILQFFAMTGIKFMDEITAPRRSTHPSSQGARQARNPEEISLAEYAVAVGIDLPQLVLYSRVSNDLQAWIEKSKSDFFQAEDEASKITPELFAEYYRADEEGQAELLHQLKLIRTNARALAKSDWYDWKLQWLEGLRVTAEKTFKSLEADARILDSIRQTADEIIPALKDEYEEVMRELEKEQAEVAEIETSDQDYLNELKASIAEQNIEVEALRAEVAEGRAQLAWLQERQTEADTQTREALSFIAEAERHLQVQQNSTRSEVFRLKGELEALEDLHMFRVTKVEADLFEYVYSSKFRVSLPCKDFTPDVKRAAVTRLDKARSGSKDRFPRLSDFLFSMAKEQIVHGQSRTTRQIVQRLSDYWSSCAQLRSQLKLITIRYPVEVEILQEHAAFKANVMILFPAVTAKAFVSFFFDARTFLFWPMAMGSLRCDVEVAYGSVDRETILNAVTNRLREANPADNYACLLDACIEAQEIYH